ncbi:unnamed protein product [Cuscuta campestris]|uniref:Uncharacterized protein n=1 Tax=Cuscuta campestris TaxID=132261 RepID=A0A484LK83_9ASTE|nr:unnamed protein product [Cuscuta campestris]
MRLAVTGNSRLSSFFVRFNPSTSALPIRGLRRSVRPAIAAATDGSRSRETAPATPPPSPFFDGVRDFWLVLRRRREFQRRAPSQGNQRRRPSFPFSAGVRVSRDESQRQFSPFSGSSSLQQIRGRNTDFEGQPGGQ